MTRLLHGDCRDLIPTLPGGGTVVGVACAARGFPFVGIDNDPVAVETARARLAATPRPLPGLVGAGQAALAWPGEVA